jgi:hypothetical protein
MNHPAPGEITRLFGDLRGGDQSALQRRMPGLSAASRARAAHHRHDGANLGEALVKRGRYAEAEAPLLRGYRLLKQRRGPTARATRTALATLIAACEGSAPPTPRDAGE